MKRRQLLQASAALAVASSLTLAADDKPGWIDAHSHIWPPDNKQFPLAAGQTVKDLKPPSFTDDELMAIASPEGVERAVLIQHSLYHRFDNRVLIDAIERHPKRFRAVGMVDDHERKAGEKMKELLKQGVTGFRITPFIRKDKPEAWLETDGMHAMWKTAAETRQPMCCLINADNLPGVMKMCEKFPETPVVIDHFARIGVDGEMRDADIKQLAALAKHKHSAVKISAFYALGKMLPPHDELIPMIKRLFEAFGPDRLMWASDCPYQVQGDNNYKASISLVRDRLDFITAAERVKLLRGTAERVFFFK